MRCLTVLQPWAALLIVGAKRYETRSWRTHHRGPLVIHAGLRTVDVDLPLDPKAIAALMAAYGVKPSSLTRLGDCEQLPCGAALGVVELVDVAPAMEVGSKLTRGQRLLGDFSPGRFAWRVINPRPFRKPVPMRGSQGLWDIDDQVVEQALT